MAFDPNSTSLRSPRCCKSSSQQVGTFTAPSNSFRNCAEPKPIFHTSVFQKRFAKSWSYGDNPSVHIALVSSGFCRRMCWNRFSSWYWIESLLLSLFDPHNDCKNSQFYKRKKLKISARTIKLVKIIIILYLQLFVYLFAPLSNHLKDIDFKTNLRLENGVKIWAPMSEFRHPNAPCFTAHCRPKPRALWTRSNKVTQKPQQIITDIFVGTS